MSVSPRLAAARDLTTRIAATEVQLLAACALVAPGDEWLRGRVRAAVARERERLLREVAFDALCAEWDATVAAARAGDAEALAALPGISGRLLRRCLDEAVRLLGDEGGLDAPAEIMP